LGSSGRRSLTLDPTQNSKFQLHSLATFFSVY
jgi:hypothetical protein